MPVHDQGKNFPKIMTKLVENRMPAEA